MAEHSEIEWTDATWNPITGCSVVSPGCTNCYAMKLAGTRMKHHWSRIGLTRDSKAGPVWTGELRFNAEWLDQPLRWKKPRMIFVVAHGDLFHEAVPDEWIDRVFAVMSLAPQHTYQVLTKRPERMLASLPTQWPLSNVWLGTSVEDQARADQRRAPLAAVARAGWTTFVSYEPALGPVDWAGWEFLNWLISGGESGASARATQRDWHRAARDFCARAAVPYFFKQWGEYSPTSDANGMYMARFGRKVSGRLLDGVEHSGMPVNTSNKGLDPTSRVLLKSSKLKNRKQQHLSEQLSGNPEAGKAVKGPAS